MNLTNFIYKIENKIIYKLKMIYFYVKSRYNNALAEIGAK